jgi:hypothetical protein
MRSGDTVVMLTPGSGNRIPHLWFIITDPDPVNHLCATVSLTTLKANKDQSVVLGPLDHSFINRASVVHYIGSLIVASRRLDQFGRNPDAQTLLVRVTEADTARSRGLAVHAQEGRRFLQAGVAAILTPSAALPRKDVV